jgi:hypothetical protein
VNVRQIVDVTLPGTNDLSAEPDGSDRSFRPRRPNASPFPAGAPTADPAQERVIRPRAAIGAGPVISPGPVVRAGAPLLFADGMATIEIPVVRSRRSRWIRLRRRLGDPAMVLALATMLVLVGAAIWVGFEVVSRDGVRRGNAAGWVPAVPATADQPRSPVASAPPVVSASPTASASASAKPTAAQPTRTRTTAPPTRTARATVTVVNDPGGAFQLGLEVTNVVNSAQNWEVVLTFPVRVTNVRSIGDGTATGRNNQVTVRGRAAAGGTSAVAIGGTTIDGSTLRTWTCTINGLPC